jgi:type IV secretion system protein VirB4
VGDAPEDWLPVFHEQLARRRAANGGLRSPLPPGAGGVR